MSQLSLFEMDGMTSLIYEALDSCGYPYEIERHETKKNYNQYGVDCFVKTKCGRLLDMFVATSRSAKHQVYIVYENLSDAVIEKHLSRVEVEYK